MNKRYIISFELNEPDASEKWRLLFTLLNKIDVNQNAYQIFKFKYSVLCDYDADTVKAIIERAFDASEDVDLTYYDKVVIYELHSSNLGSINLKSAEKAHLG